MTLGQVHNYYKYLGIFIAILTLVGCSEPECTPMDGPGSDFTNLCESSAPVGTDWSFDVPFYFSDPTIPADNPMKVEAIELGRFLFWEKQLSANNTMSCGSCHSPQAAFSDPAQFSVGIDGIAGNRNSMALVNLAWNTNGFFWDGRSHTLEEQILEPVENPIEMHNTWENALAQLETSELYPPMFEAAFGSDCIDSVRATKAMAQFIRSMVSSTSKYDKSKIGQAQLTESELLGQELWNIEGGAPEEIGGGMRGGDCFHCHLIPGGQFRDNEFHNNGLDSVFTDLGRGGVTNEPSDMGLFKVPTLRNIEYSAPYMHDGRFNTLEEVMDHYETGGVGSSTVNVNMLWNTESGLGINPVKRQALIDFMKTLSDPDFISNPDFSDPH